MSVEDYPFAVRLANTMNWNMTRQDLEFIASLEPEGCFVLVKGAERVGMVTCISYGLVGWFGNLIVKEGERNKGAGTLLVKHAIDYFHGKGIETVGLYAYPQLTKFYTNIGFKHYEDFAVMQATPTQSIEKNLLNVTPQNLQAVAEFDRCCFGWDRHKLLEAIVLAKGNFGYFYSEKGKVVGYVLAKNYGNMAEVGPLVCQPGRLDEAKQLLECVLGKLVGLSVYLCVSKNENVFISKLVNIGFTEKFSVARMFLGHVATKDCIYLAESLERG
ncbi:MAG: GNAT family N-acetyltransferase [Candidatus Bathyarchaeota archaeon]|nr:GNAT family N-acetyltransferase [Candidatus Bathyarchaeota archaeon]